MSPPFNVEILQPSGIFVLKRDQLASEEPKIVRDIRRLVTILQARGVGVLEWDQDDDDDIYDSDPEYAL